MLTKERLIYTAGTFKIDEDLGGARRLIIRSSVLRLPPTTNYQNERSNPAKYFLGYCTVFVNDYVYEIFPIEFEQQIILFWDNPDYQVFAKVVCESDNISGNIVRLGAAMTPPALLIPVPGIPGTFSGCPYTNLKFKLVFGARLQISAVGEPMEFCEGYNIPSTVPNLDPPPLPYPPEQARDEDPPRSEPEAGENPGDTAPATIEDPDSGLTTPPCIMTVGLFRADLSVTDFVSGEVPNATYATAFLTTIGPGTIYVVQSTGNIGTVTVAGPFNPGSVVVSIVSVEVVC
jgi:hypothetical protein